MLQKCCLGHAEIPFYTSFGRQRQWRNGALAQVFGRPAIPLLRKYIVPAAERVGAGLLQFSAREIWEVVGGRKISWQLQKLWEGKFWENSWVVVTGKKLHAKAFQRNRRIKPIGRDETFSQTFLTYNVK